MNFEMAPRSSNLTPYFAFTRNVHGKTIHVLDQPVIMSSVCERASKSQTQGSLPLLLKTTLDEYHTKASLEYTEVTFDFGTQKKLNRWRAKAKKLGAKLGASDFKRKIIFVTVHSEDEKGGDVAMRVEEFMSCLFSPPLEESHSRPCNSQSDSKAYFINCRELSSSLSSNLFSYHTGVQVLIEGHALGDVLQDLLNVSLGLWMHSDVILFHVAGLISSKAPVLVEACLSRYHPSHHRV
ncbi:hypothetical protein BKA83DRAFT_4488720 [Pisolithus microcarpus]|nr:hypothetical protein BKA83DRAFT_4488720 [Pisolithus microcarpus]